MTPPFFRFAGVVSGVVADRLDLGLIVSDRPARTVAIFTRNRASAAPVRVSRRSLEASRGRARAIVVNSGNANACTGPGGMRDARAMIRAAARGLDLPASEVLVASTGVIGVPLDMDAIAPGIARACERLSTSSHSRFARAILTTDTAPKSARRQLRLGRTKVSIWGCTKGAGMIAPDMATTLSFLATDAPLGRAQLQRCLQRAADPTYNSLSIDGDTSTNDMIALIANGAVDRRLSAAAVRTFEDALTDLLRELAIKLMRDGEGVHHVVEIVVSGARSDGTARDIAKTIANSPLVKTAIAGGDPNWGRILAAAGRAPGAPNLDRADLRIGGVAVLEGGVPSRDRRWEDRASRVMKRRQYPIALRVGSGRGAAHYLTCDLSAEYVALNADYRS